LYFGRSCSVRIMQLRISSLDRGFWPGSPSVVEIALAPPPVAEPDVHVASAA
jgi:hypothetical protein